MRVLAVVLAQDVLQHGRVAQQFAGIDELLFVGFLSGELDRK